MSAEILRTLVSFRVVPKPRGYALLFGNIEAGAVRGGVASREGWRDVTQLRARRSVMGDNR